MEIKHDDKPLTADASTSIVDSHPYTTPHLKRNITALSIVGLSMSICNGWAAMSSTIVIGLSQGGTPVILYGLIFTSIINVFLALSLGEMASAYPSAGGQYVWASVLAGPRTRRGIAFTVGWTNIFSWLTIVASVVIISAEVIFALVQTYNPDFVIQRWMVFLVFEAINVVSLCFNLFALSNLPRMGVFFLFFSTAIFLTVLITCLAKAPTYQSNHFVWGTYTNGIDWTNGFVVVVTGLVNPAYVFAGLDGAIHIAEECLNPARAVPYALVCTVGVGFLTGFVFSVGLLYCVQDLVSATDSELPFLTIIVQATNSKAAGAVFMSAFLVVLMVSSNSVHQATSRLIWSFARDRGLPYSSQVARIDPKLHVPVIPLLISFTGVTILGALYVASTTVYNSIIACCIILGNISFSIPAVQLMLRGRRMNPNRWLKLGALGWAANIVTVVWTIFTTVMWLFPITPHPDAADMNYSVVVLVVMGLIALLDWVLHGRKHFVGPKLEDVQSHMID
ncbi:putative choline transport protein [Naematelia encephala]|uniref:Putative choline transport protein n=1 Tax=Naematelia encephala TaxID=71784 RepID=A0A1Y2AJR4_9TREE|nr:putative choline transport protein [Naematelia encephala]